NDRMGVTLRFSNRALLPLGVIALCCFLAGCASAQQPQPTALSLPTVTLQPIADTRTPLPTLTPSVTLAIAAQPSQSTQAATAVSIVATVAATNTPGVVQPTSTSALAAATRIQTITPLPTQASLLPGSPPPIDIKLPA